MSKIKYTDQLYDDGAVIGYHPRLELSKENQQEKIEEDNTITLLTQYAQDYSQYSKTVQGYLKNTPSKVLGELDSVLNTIQEIKDRLVTKFNSMNYASYNDIEAFIQGIRINNEYHIEFINAHDTIDEQSSLIPQILKILIQEEEFVQNVADTIKKLYYNDKTLSTEQTEEIDEKLKKVITDNDIAGTNNNYILLAKDSTMNKIISIFSDKIDSALLELETCAYLTTDCIVNNPSLKDSIQELWDDITYDKDLRDDIYSELHKNLDTAIKTLYNYYGKRKNMDSYYTFMINGATNSEYLLSKINTFVSKTDKSIEEVNKTLLTNVYYIKKMDELLTEKGNLSAISSTINYN